MFQHTAARRRLVERAKWRQLNSLFQHTAARRRLVYRDENAINQIKRFNTQPPEGGWRQSRRLLQARFSVSTHSRPKAAGSKFKNGAPVFNVSTHSRPKAAGNLEYLFVLQKQRFNTQPPEGGWKTSKGITMSFALFQHTAARRRLVLEKNEKDFFYITVSTHSRPKAAGLSFGF